MHPSPAGGALDVRWAIRAGRLDLLLAHAEASRGVAARRFALDALEQGLALADPGTASAEALARARALGAGTAAIESAELAPPPHAVRVPLVDHDAGRALLRTFYVTYDPTGGALEHALALGPVARAEVAFALSRAAQIARATRDRGRFHLVAAQPSALVGASVDGSSLSAAALVSAVSAFSDRPVRARLAITGALRGESVAAVGGIADKVRAAIDAGARALIVPAACEAEARRAAGSELVIEAVTDIPSLLACALDPQAARLDVDGAVRAAREAFRAGWRGYRWPAIAEQLERLAGRLPEGRPELAVEMLARLGAAQRHLGDPVRSLRVLDAAVALVRARQDAVPDEPRTMLAQQRAMTLARLFRFGDARRAAAEAIVIARRARLRGELIKALGCRGLVAMARGDHRDAVRVFAEALEITLERSPDDAARSRAYLMEALGKSGRGEEAEREWDAAMREVDAGTPSARRAKESWVRTSWGSALVALGRNADAIAVLDVPCVHRSMLEEPLPGLLARRWLGMALARGGDPVRGHALLAASPGAHRQVEPSLRFVAQVNVLIEASERAAQGALDADARARALVALEHVPSYGDAGAWLGALAARAEEALAGAPTKSARAPLAKLLTRAARIVG